MSSLLVVTLGLLKLRDWMDLRIDPSWQGLWSQIRRVKMFLERASMGQRSDPVKEDVECFVGLKSFDVEFFCITGLFPEVWNISWTKTLRHFWIFVLLLFLGGGVCLFLFGHAYGMWKFLGQGSNPCHSSDPSHHSNSAGTLTTRPPGNSIFEFYLSLNPY